MSNIELVRAAYRAFNDDRDGLRAYLDPNVHWYPALGQLLDRELYVGPDEIIRLVSEEIPAVLEDFGVELLEVVEPEPDLVIATLRYTGRHARTGVRVEQSFAHVIQLRDGRAVEMRAYPTREAALEAIGAGG